MLRHNQQNALLAALLIAITVITIAALRMKPRNFADDLKFLKRNIKAEMAEETILNYTLPDHNHYYHFFNEGRVKKRLIKKVPH